MGDFCTFIINFNVNINIKKKVIKLHDYFFMRAFFLRGHLSLGMCLGAFHRTEGERGLLSYSLKGSISNYD